MGLFRRTKQDDDAAEIDLDERSPRTGLKYKDILVLGEMQKAGAALTEPRHAVYYLYFDTEAQAAEAAVLARSRDFDAEVREPLPGTEQWSLVCERHGIVLDIPTVKDNTDFFEAVAEAHGGEFDGWEASI